MSYTSENEDYYDAFDVTPMQSNSFLASSDGQRSSGIRNKNEFQTQDKDGLRMCKDLSFDSNDSVITSYDTPVRSDSSRTKCSVVILEPDIVQSTKSSSLPRQQLPLSTITPRKKKAKSADIPLNTPEDLPSSSKSHCLMAEGEGSGSVTPKMPECSSPVLDISSATKGSCLVSLCDQVQHERSRRDSGESWGSAPSKDLSSTEDLLSSDHILDEEDEEEDAADGGDGVGIKSSKEEKGNDDKQSATTQFSPSAFSTPLSSFSPHFASTSTTFTPLSDNLHSFATQDNLHHSDTLPKLQHPNSCRKAGLSRASSNKTATCTAPVASIDHDDADANESDKKGEEEEEEEEEDEKVVGEQDDEEDEEENAKSSPHPSDQEILNKTMVLNLDTGETVALCSAEEKLPKCINPLSLHIMRRTKEYSSSDSNLHKQEASDNEGVKPGVPLAKKNKPTGKKRMRIKQFFGKTVNRFKSVGEKSTHTDDTSTDDDDIAEHRKSIKIKNSNSHKGPYDFELLVPIQEIGDNKSGAVWTMKFSHCGRLLATGGQDGLLRVWVLQDALDFFTQMRIKYSDVGRSNVRSDSSSDNNESQESPQKHPPEGETDADQSYLPFHKHPFSTYKGHTADVLDISWSKNYFLLSSSMDKTVRLWHVSRWECLCCFQHIDFVTAISFHPKDDRYFLSGSLDGKLRLWNIPDKKVALWNEVVGPAKLITAANFCLNGRFAVVGTYDGRCIFYNSEHLKYFTQIHVRSTRGRNKRGRKITGVEPFPGDNKILVTSNDSRIRLYDLRDLTLTCKFKGVTNNTSQIKASFSHDGKYVVCGSEDQFMYIWKTQHEFYKFSSARKDRNNYWEGIKAHSAVVTNAIFAPDPEVIIKPQFEFVDTDDKANSRGVKGEVLVSADYLGSIRIFINKFKPPS